MSPRSIIERQEDPDVCKFEVGDASAMRSSGADQYLSDFLTNQEDAAWSKGNWLATLDEKTTKTADGGSYRSTLNCSQLEDRAHCHPPDQDVQCRYFTPPEVFWIRLWAPNVQTFFDRARNSLDEEAIGQALSIDSLTEDFDLGDLDSPDNNPMIAAISYLIAPLLGFSGAVKGFVKSRPGASGTNTKAGMVPEGGVVLGNIAESVAGGANFAAWLNAKNQQTPPTPRQLAKAVGEVYLDTFNSARENIRMTNRQFFAGHGEGEPDMVGSFQNGLSSVGSTINRQLHPVAAILGSGEFASGGSGNLEGVLKVGYKIARDQMVGAVLAAQKVVLFGNTKSSQDDCKEFGSWWNDDVCHKFIRVNIEGDGVLSNKGAVPEDKLKLIADEGKYDIKIEEMMENIRQCRNDFGREPKLDATFQTAYPPCHFGMAYFSAEGEPCNMWPGPYGLEHAGCSGSYEELYWQRFKNNEEVPRQGSYPGATLDKWMIPDLK